MVGHKHIKAQIRYQHPLVSTHLRTQGNPKLPSTHVGWRGGGCWLRTRLCLPSRSPSPLDPAGHVHQRLATLSTAKYIQTLISCLFSSQDEFDGETVLKKITFAV